MTAFYNFIASITSWGMTKALLPVSVLVNGFPNKSRVEKGQTQFKEGDLRRNSGGRPMSSSTTPIKSFTLAAHQGVLTM